MGDAALFGAIAGAFVGFVVATAIASPRFTYLGGNLGRFEGGMGCFAGLLLRVVLMAIGAGLGAALASALS